MRKNTLGQTGLTTSHLGFGCVQLTSHQQRGDAVRILEHAFSLGITHFDVSRIYGFGRAEGILGEFLRGKRDQVTVATKFGIQPPSGLAGNRRVINLAKKLLGPFPNLLRRARDRGSKMVQSGVFTPEAAISSLEKSLRELGTDAVDIFLLHEATITDTANERLAETLQRQVDRGTIRCLGVASSFRSFQNDSADLASLYQVLQFEDNALARNLLAFRCEGRAFITHSVFQPLAALRSAISAQPERAQKYSSLLNLDLSDPAVIGSLLMQSALRSNALGVVLFSSTSPARVTANVRDAETCRYSQEQLSGFSEFAGAIHRTDPPQTTMTI